MNAKWYASTLFIILVLFGLTKAPKKALNQQIVLQFVDLQLASKVDHDELLAEIQQKLELLGIEAIEIVEKNQRQISVRYYSELDADTIEQFLTVENQSATSNDGELPKDFPKEKESKSYQLVVSDLYTKVDGTFNSKGTFVSNHKNKDLNKKFAPPVALLFGSTFKTNPDNTVKIDGKDLIALDEFSYQIPEIRAGPYQKINT